MSQLKEEFRTNGYIVLRNLLPAEEVSFYLGSVDISS